MTLETGIRSFGRRASFLALTAQTLEDSISPDRLYLAALGLIVTAIQGCVDSAEFLEVAVDDLAQNLIIVAPCLPREFFDPRFVRRRELNRHRWSSALLGDLWPRCHESPAAQNGLESCEVMIARDQGYAGLATRCCQ